MVTISPSDAKVLTKKGYNLVKKVGEGAYAQVFLAEYQRTGKDEYPQKLACKIIDTSKSPKELKSKFLPRELDILIRLNHPHVIHIQGIFQRKDKFFIFMRYAENGDLLDQVINKGPISEAQSRIWTRQLGLAIQYLHEMEVAHRDLKCENCLITGNNNIKLADFGFARFIIDSQGKQALSSTYCGSLAYAAPEVLRGRPYCPKIADMWSFGIIIYVMLNKAMPFEDSNAKKLYECQMCRKWKFRSTVANIISENVKTIIRSLMEPEEKKRWDVKQVIDSPWILMDKRLTVVTEDEQSGLLQAQKERISYIDSQIKKTSIIKMKKSKNTEEINILKMISANEYRISIITDPNESKIKQKDEKPDVQQDSPISNNLENT